MEKGKMNFSKDLLEKIKKNWQIIIPAIVLIISLVIFIIAFSQNKGIGNSNQKYTLKITEVKWNKSDSYAPSETEFEIDKIKKLDYNGCYNEDIHFEVSKITNNGITVKSNKPLEQTEFNLKKNRKFILKTTDKEFWCTYEFRLI